MRRAAILVVAACGAPAHVEPWTEHEIGSTHVQASVATPAQTNPAPANPLTDAQIRALTPAQIDQLDEPHVLAALDVAPSARLALRAARLAHHRGDDADARALLARAATAADEAQVHAQLAALAIEVAAPRVDPSKIAVLLPLSGTYAPIGAELRAAIELAPAADAKWLFLDTRGTPEGASAAVEQAFSKGAIGILGPVGTRESLAAARAASLRGIAIALLAPEDGADAQAGVFRLVDSPADEGRAVAQLAQQNNFGAVGVFAPRDDVGQEAADAFAEEAQRLGIVVTKRGAYDPTGGNVEPDVKDFLDLVPARNPRLAEHLARKGGRKGLLSFSPDIPYSLLYVPDRYDRAAIVAAFLPYYNVELRTTEFPDPARLARKHGGHVPQVVQLVGGAGWHHPSLPVRGGDAVQGALIVDAFAGDLGGDAAVQFGAAFAQKTSRTASAAAAEAFDGAALVAKARAEAAQAPDPRRAFRSALAHARLDDGACGPAQMGPDGELSRAPSVLEVQGDELILAP